MDARLIPIKNDLFSIADRIKSIDDKYSICYNGEKKRFEVYGGKDGGLQCVLPYSQLDSRALDYVRETRIERIDDILAKIEKENEKVARDAVKDAVRKARQDLVI